MDLSKLSDEDLSAVAKGDMTRVSDAGLQLLAAPPQDSSRDLPMGTAAAISFASTPEEKRAYLDQKYPGAKYGKEVIYSPQKSDQENPSRMAGGPSGSDLPNVYGVDPQGRMKDAGWLGAESPGGPRTQDIVTLPGETEPRRMSNQRGLGLVGSLAGQVPTALAAGTAGLLGMTGNVPASAGVMAAGEVGRKEFGHRFLDIPRLQSGSDYAKDVAIQGLVGGGMQAGANLIRGAPVWSGRPSVAAPGRAEGMLDSGAPELPTVSGPAGTQPTSPEDMLSRVKEAGIDPSDGASLPKDLPTMDEVNRALAKTSPWNFPPTQEHEAMLTNRIARDAGQTLQNLPSEWAQGRNSYDFGMKQEGRNKINQAIQSLGEGAQKNPDALTAGQDLISKISEKYEANKDSLSPLFQALKDNAPPPGSGTPGLVEKLGEAFPRISNRITVDPEEGIQLAPWDRTTGMDKGVYDELGGSLKEMSKPDVSFDDLQGVREHLRTQIDPADPKKYAPLNQLRKVALDHMADWADSYNPGSKYKELATQYAKNESAHNQMESILGGKLDNPNALLTAVPEKSLDKIFSNSNTIAVAKDVLGEKDFQNAAGDYLSGKVAKYTDAGHLKAGALSRDLAKKMPLLRQALPAKVLDEISGSADIMRLAADQPPINPSGTAKTHAVGGLLGKIKGLLEPIEEGLPFKPSQTIEGIHGALTKPAAAAKAAEAYRGLLRGNK